MAKSMITLMPGEEAKVILEADMYASTEGLIQNIIGFVIRIIETILGMNRRGILTVTNKRVIIEAYQNIFWCFEKKRAVVTVMPQAVSSVDFYYNALLCCCCRKWMFRITANNGVGWEFVMRNGFEEASAVANYTIETLFGSK